MENTSHSDTWVIIATGQSLKAEDVEYVKGKASVCVVSDAYKLAPWADIMVSHDSAWWMKNPDALKFKGKKYCKFSVTKTERFSPQYLPRGCNSGLMAMFVAKSLGAKKIILLGFDMHGTHYFGKHKHLKNTTPERFKVHMQQFYSFTGCEVVNCTEGTKLTKFPLGKLRDVL